MLFFSFHIVLLLDDALKSGSHSMEGINEWWWPNILFHFISVLCSLFQFFFSFFEQHKLIRLITNKNKINKIDSSGTTNNE